MSGFFNYDLNIKIIVKTGLSQIFVVLPPFKKYSYIIFFSFAKKSDNNVFKEKISISVIMVYHNY